MADDRYDAPPAADASSVGPDGDGQSDGAAARSSWSNLWQIPTIVASGVLIAIGVYVAMNRAPAHDFGGALSQVEQLIEAGRFDDARARLTDVIEPNLDEATPLQRARFLAAVGDWLAVSQVTRGTRDERTTRLVASNYGEAASLGLTLAPVRLERWAHALIALDDVAGAQKRLAELDALDIGTDDDGEIRARRNRVLRAMIDHSLLRSDRSVDDLLAILRRYRDDVRLSPADQVWAAARAAEARLQDERAREALDHLLVDMRRLELRAGDDADVPFGELYVLLARAHYDLGQFDDAKFNVQRGLSLLASSHPARGHAEVLLGAMAVAVDDLEAAADHFDVVAQHFIGTPSYWAGLLGRAEVRGKLGRDEASLTDYARLRDLLNSSNEARTSRRAVARSLLERHDAVLATGDLALALSYATLAESLFDPAQVPADVLFRIAATNRQAGENLLPAPPESPADLRPAARRLMESDPAVRAQASVHFGVAATYFVRHARAVRLEPGEEETWAQSLWWAADSFDRGGRHDEAIRHFREYVSGRGVEARRAEAQYRLGLSLQAVFEYGEAAAAFEQLLTEHPKTLFASMSHVPLARCYLALDRRPEAEAELLAVIAGQRFIEPSAVHYRDALIELGRIYHNAGELRKAIERLTTALDRYPDDNRRPELLFRLADSYRRSAQEHEARIEEAATLAPSERLRLSTLRTDQLRQAMQFFDLVVSEHELAPSTEPDPLGEDFLRSAFYYRADCSFELGLFEEAIEYYTQGARKYRDHHSSMHALIQIYNCYNELGDPDGANNAHRRALVRLSQLPDQAFEAPDALMDRQAWERWLRNSPVGPVAAAGTTDG
ncbi:MAG: tetratricopeptide repeat protein [Planctomycetota bacterium]